MSRNVFISFRFSDGQEYKEKLSRCLDRCSITNNFSEDVDRGNATDQTIQNYLYAKLRRTSVTIALLTPQAIEHRKNVWGRYDDWIYDEIRYSLEDRGDNRTTGLVAVYTPEAEPWLIERTQDPNAFMIRKFNNLVRKNMMNVKEQYKKNPNVGCFDNDYDSYCSLISFNEFVHNIGKYIEIAIEKRDNAYRYRIKKRMDE